MLSTKSIAMNKNLRVNRSIKINSSPEDVYHAITDPGTIKQFFFGTDAISEWKPGSSLLFKGCWEDGRTYEDKGRILDADEGKLLRYTYWSNYSGLEDIPENYSIVSYYLKESDGGTLVEVSQEGFANEESHAHAEGGWSMVLENLKKLLEN